MPYSIKCADSRSMLAQPFDQFTQGLEQKFLASEARAEGNFSEASKRKLFRLAMANAVANLSSTERRGWSNVAQPEAAHVIHAARGGKYSRAGVLAREFVRLPQLSSTVEVTEALNGASNAL